jgi:hypothetical protein
MYAVACVTAGTKQGEKEYESNSSDDETVHQDAVEKGVTAVIYLFGHFGRNLWLHNDHYAELFRQWK